MKIDRSDLNFEFVVPSSPGRLNSCESTPLWKHEGRNPYVSHSRESGNLQKKLQNSNQKSLIVLKLFYFVFMLSIVFCAKAIASSEQKPEKGANVKSYSFRPLLIQGKKRLVQKTKDMKVETSNILETKIFFAETDFKKRIFSDEGLE
ncbi:MAG: hypothetical protein OXJ52_07065 [Oligoflexia bacterium]|nr:hypothetical protein [Oligoflexia bacterium]